MVTKTADGIMVGDIILTKDNAEHLVLRVKHKEDSTRLRTVDIATGVPTSRLWKHSRHYRVNTTLSNLVAA